MLQLSSTSNDLILDFFAGSGTTAHAVMALNAEDGGNRRFICVQLPEPTDEDSEAHKAGYATIADISKERIRRAVAKLNEAGNPDHQDRGFRVLKLNQSNFRQWQRLGPDATEDQIAEQLELHIEHVDATASPEDLLFEILLKAGHQPTEKISVLDLSGTLVYSIADGALLVCLAPTITKELIDAVAELEPQQFICLDSAFGGNDQLKANAVDTFSSRVHDGDILSRIEFRTI
jgi:adenine-specific DNA-methyltransferase